MINWLLNKQQIYSDDEDLKLKKDLKFYQIDAD